MGYSHQVKAQKKVIIHYFGKDSVYLGFSIRKAAPISVVCALLSAWCRGVTHIAVFEQHANDNKIP